MGSKVRINGKLKNVEFLTHIIPDDICILMARQDIHRHITGEEYGRLPSYRAMAKYLTKTFVPVRTSKAGPSVTLTNDSASVDQTETVSVSRGNVVLSDTTGAY